MGPMEYDLGDVDIDALDKGFAPAGWYGAVITEISDEGEGNYKFTFTVDSPPEWKGAIVTDDLDNPALVESDKAQDVCRKRVGIYGSRLGLFEVLPNGNKSADWKKALGRPVIIHVKVDEFEKKDGSKGQKSKLHFDGIYDRNDKRAIDKVKGGLAPVTTHTAQHAATTQHAAPAQTRQSSQQNSLPLGQPGPYDDTDI